MISREEQLKQALEKIEEALTHLWSANLYLWEHKSRKKVLEAWNLAFDVKEELQIELYERRFEDGNKENIR